ncbi:LysR substrate-binding domain-containing protein [Oryzibacter oryziterrae]|uniref:LysR substrate-binding domain-containing protein n=1 Tax=Oryzibacter oryziterrae TaxID=2766474 RepID=UPI001F1F2C8C|nr:LysR substrate-binding domain-containing protein [Oryzibacter oryziterrae]
MKRGRLPLTALRSFEAAGRLGSFTLAAEELHVSQAAISRQIRELEDRVGHALFERRPRAVSLTDSGQTLLATLTTAFDAIDGTLESLRCRPEPARIILSCEPSFAACWLLPHLSDFQAAHPEIDVTLEADHRLAQFRAHEAEIAIRFTSEPGGWPRTECQQLCESELLAVAAPEIAAELAGQPPTALLGQPLLFEESRQLWTRWFAEAGVTLPDTLRGPVFTDGGLVMQAALRGQGVALLDRSFVVEALSEGRLCRVADTTFVCGSYWLVVRRFTALRSPARRFVDWISAKFAGPAH